MIKRLIAGLTLGVPALVLLLASAPAYAADGGYGSEPPPTDNGRWVGPIAFVIFVAVVAGMLFIANAYRKNNDNHR